MEVNDRVITVLFSSAAVMRMVTSQISSSGEFVAQVIPIVGTRNSPANIVAARRTSDVLPEREITTAWRFGVCARANFGKSSGSEAGSGLGQIEARAAAEEQPLRAAARVLDNAGDDGILAEPPEGRLPDARLRQNLRKRCRVPQIQASRIH